MAEQKKEKKKKIPEEDIEAGIQKVMEEKEQAMKEKKKTDKPRRVQMTAEEKLDETNRILDILYKDQNLKLREKVQNLCKKEKDPIMKWGEEVGSNDITKEQLVAFLMSDKVSEAFSLPFAETTFKMLYGAKDEDKKAKKGETETISRVELVRFANGYKSKKHVRAVTVADTKWVMGQLQTTTFAEIDQNDEMKIDLKKFTDFLTAKNVALSDERIADIFNQIDIKGTGKISVVAYEKWKSQYFKGNEEEQEVKYQKLMAALNK